MVLSLCSALVRLHLKCLIWFEDLQNKPDIGKLNQVEQMMNLILLQLSSGCLYRRQHQTLPCALVTHSKKMRNNRHKLQQRRFQSYIKVWKLFVVRVVKHQTWCQGGLWKLLPRRCQSKTQLDELSNWATEQHQQTLKLDLLLVQRIGPAELQSFLPV